MGVPFHIYLLLASRAGIALVLAVTGLEVRVSFHCWAQSRWCSSAVSRVSSSPRHLVIFLELASLFLSHTFY